MSDKHVPHWLPWWSRFFRLLAGIGLLVLAGRFTMQRIQFAWTTGTASETEVAAGGATARPGAVLQELRDTQAKLQARLPDLEALQAEMSGEAGGTLAPPPQPPKPVVRSIIVDVGPARSEVWIGGHRLGRTPYAGQWACVSHEPVRVQVLPATGPPIIREIACRGTHLVLRK